MRRPFDVRFPDGKSAKVCEIGRSDEIRDALSALGLGGHSKTIVLVGGAEGMEKSEIVQLRPLFSQVLARVAEEIGACVIDGGTDIGVMSLVGVAREKTRSSFSLLGVAPSNKIALPGRNRFPFRNLTPLEPNHTHFLLVPGSDWGDESPWLAEAATWLSGDEPSITILINGGQLAWRDALLSVTAGRPVLVIGGSGRAADELANALHVSEARQGVQKVPVAGPIKVLDLNRDIGRVGEVVKHALSARQPSFEPTNCIEDSPDPESLPEVVSIRAW